jgi:hypothetical protein
LESYINENANISTKLSSNLLYKQLFDIKNFLI